MKKLFVPDKDGVEGVQCGNRCKKTKIQCQSLACHKGGCSFPAYALTPNSDTGTSNYCALRDIIIQTYKSLLTSPQDVYDGNNFINEAFATILQYSKNKVTKETLLQTLPEEGLEGIQCKCKCSQTKIQCQRNLGHKKRHSYNIPGLLSLSTINKIVKAMTDGQIKNLNGLDNTDVTKGYDNFERMKNIVEKLVNVGDLDESVRKDFYTRIRTTQVYHKTGFIDHLGSSSAHVCTCIECGFHDEMKDPIPCKHRSQKSHLPPCNECTECFKLISDLLTMHEEVTSGIQCPNSRQGDTLLRLGEEIHQCKRNLEDYRAHIVQKWWEGIEEASFYKNLKPGEAAVICDWKMKILERFFRENMQRFFGKKGFSCLGFMVVFGSNDENKEVKYFFFLSEDTCQDVNSVLAAKTILYDDILPKEGVSKVHFRADGAACFSQSLLKACMPLWKTWTKGKIDEISFKISVAGCGKTNLDSLFGVIEHMITTLVATGYSFTMPDELLHIFEENPVKGCTFLLFMPNRSLQHMIRSVKGVEYLKTLTQMYNLKCTDDAITGYRHSNLGDGVRFLKKDIERAITIKNIEQFTEELRTERSTIFDPSSGLPILVDSNANEGDNIDFDTVELEDLIPPPPRGIIIKSLYEPPTNHIDKNTSILHGTTFAKRKLGKLKNKRTIRNEKVEQSQIQEREAEQQSGLFCCTEMNDHHQVCTERFLQQKRLAKHISEGKHHYPSVDSKTAALRDFTDNSSGNFKISVGSRLNLMSIMRNKLVTEDDQTIKDLSETRFDSYWSSTGCHNSRHNRGVRHSDALIADLEEMFMQGQTGGQKLTPAQAHEKLNLMTRADEPSRFKYTPDPNNENGNMINQIQIKSWFATRSSGGPKKTKETIEKLKASCRGFGLPTKKKSMLLEILKLHDLMNEKDAGDYSNMVVANLENECKDRGMFANKNGDVDADTDEGKKVPTEKDYIKLMLDYFITLEKKEEDNK